METNPGNYPTSLSNNDPKSRITYATLSNDRNNGKLRRSLQTLLHTLLLQPQGLTTLTIDFYI